MNGFCAEAGTGGGAGFGSVFVPFALTGGGVASVTCPANRPYLRSYVKGWGSRPWYGFFRRPLLVLVLVRVKYGVVVRHFIPLK